MNVDRIEKLLDKYWLCETTVAEEQELREFFLQKEVPQHLLKYKHLFELQQEEAEAALNEEFDEKILTMIGAEGKKSGKRFATLRPFLQIAASIAIIVSLWLTIQPHNGRTENDPWLQDTYTSPQQALAEVQKVLSLVSGQMEKGQDFVMEKMEKAEPLTQIIKK